MMISREVRFIQANKACHEARKNFQHELHLMGIHRGIIYLDGMALVAPQYRKYCPVHHL